MASKSLADRSQNRFCLASSLVCCNEHISSRLDALAWPATARAGDLPKLAKKAFQALCIAFRKPPPVLVKQSIQVRA